MTSFASTSVMHKCLPGITHKALVNKALLFLISQAPLILFPSLPLAPIHHLDAVRRKAMAMVTTEAAAAATTAATAAAEKPQDVEKPDYAPYNGASTTADGGTGARARRGDGGGGVVDSVVARWRREDMLDKSPLALHAAAAIFAFVALVLVASNQHGDWMQFDRYQEYRCASGRRLLGVRSSSACSSIRVYFWLIVASSVSLPRYLLAIASLALLYSLAQAARHAHRMRGGVDPVSSASARLLDFVGDQASDCFQLLACS